MPSGATATPCLPGPKINGVLGANGLLSLAGRKAVHERLRRRRFLLRNEDVVAVHAQMQRLLSMRR